jgi:hypothetical protein
MKETYFEIQWKKLTSCHECFNEAIKRTYYILEDPGRSEIR